MIIPWVVIAKTQDRFQKQQLGIRKQPPFLDEVQLRGRISPLAQLATFCFLIWSVGATDNKRPSLALHHGPTLVSTVSI